MGCADKLNNRTKDRRIWTVGYQEGLNNFVTVNRDEIKGLVISTKYQLTLKWIT